MNRYFIFISLTLLTLLITAGWIDTHREWKAYQITFRQLEHQKAQSPDELAALNQESFKIKQIVVDKLGLVDRCITCHGGIEDPRFADAPQPFRTHPDYMGHPFEKFGCTFCHQGQGLATTTKAAHGEVEFWEEPLWNKDYIQQSCPQCHQGQEYLKKAPHIQRAQQLVREYECSSCHQIPGFAEGGTDGPNLAGIGSKPVSQLDFGQVHDMEKTLPNWLFAKLKNPQVFDPDAMMTNFELSDEEAKTLTIWLLSLTNEEIPREYLSRK